MNDIPLQDAYNTACVALGETLVVNKLQTDELLKLQTRVVELEHQLKDLNDRALGE